MEEHLKNCSNCGTPGTPEIERTSCIVLDNLHVCVKGYVPAGALEDGETRLCLACMRRVVLFGRHLE